MAISGRINRNDYKIGEVGCDSCSQKEGLEILREVDSKEEKREEKKKRKIKVKMEEKIFEKERKITGSFGKFTGLGKGRREEVEAR